MSSSRFKIIMVVLFAMLDGLVHLLSYSPDFIEKQYVLQFYPRFSSALRQFSGRFGFSVGDILYGLLIVGALVYTVRLIYKLIKGKEPRKSILLNSAYLIFLTGSVIYLLFNISWGFNYNKSRAALTFGLKEQPYSKSDLCTINSLLLQQLNNIAEDSLLEVQKSITPINELTTAAYAHLPKTYNQLQYKITSLKPSAWSWLISYWGVSGYYNPFTGEAQYNKEMPTFILPFVSCHEVAHQLGYAKENEANFVGYLAASSSDNATLRYAADFEMFLYANRNLYFLDSVSAKQYREQLPIRAKHDIQTLIKFSNSHRSFMEPLIDRIYSVFLRNNQQPQGLLSYDEVTGLLIAYYKSEGKMR